MSVEFSNKWYRETCESVGLNPDNILSSSEVDLARDRAIDMQKYLRAKKVYPDPELINKFDKRIKELDEKRVGHMLNALYFAEVVGGLGVGFDKFLENQYNRRKRLLKRT